MPGLYGYVRLGPDALEPNVALERMLGPVLCPGAAAVTETRSVDAERAVLTRQFESTDAGSSADTLVDGYILHRGEPSADARVLRAVHETGELAAFADIDGDYNVALLDEPRRSLTVVGSRHGSRHIYYRLGADYVAFATHVGALMALPGECRIDDVAVATLLNYGYPGGDRSLLQDVRLLPPASALCIDDDGPRIVCYWSPEYDNGDASASFDDLVDEAARGLDDSVSACLQRFPGTGIPISGGLDSRTILAFASRHRRELPVYHCAWYAAEARIARQLADAADARWREYDPLQFDYRSMLQEGAATSEGNVHAHQFWFLPVARDIGAENSVDVVLDGYLMDVFFGDTFLVLPKDRPHTEAECRDAIDRLWRRCHPRFVHDLFRPDFAQAYEQGRQAHLDEQMGLVDDGDVSNYIQRFSLANRSNRYSVALPNVQRQHVEYAYPGLSRRLVDLYLRLPPKLKVGAAFSRAVLARHAPEMAAIPWAKTGRPLTQDKKLADRMADRFPLRQVGSLSLLRLTGGHIDLTHRADLNRHFRRTPAFRQAFLDIIEDERTYARGWIDPEGVRRLVRRIDSGWPVFFLLQCLVTLELFHRRVVDR